MKIYLFPAIKLTLLCILVFTIFYPTLIWAAGLLSVRSGRGDIENIGQKFDRDDYFWSRPSAAGYNASASCGSNKGPSEPGYLELVRARKDTFLAHNPGVHATEIPVELLTASGSGLDPHISPEAAYIQIERIAQKRKLDKQQLKILIAVHTEGPLLGLFGPEKINVLKLNQSLDTLNP